MQQGWGVWSWVSYMYMNKTCLFVGVEHYTLTCFDRADQHYSIHCILTDLLIGNFSYMKKFIFQVMLFQSEACQITADFLLIVI